ncbi:ABC transporter substrate binding protein [Bradyrhizobium sp. JYMT SZCCT0180]|uniref:sensor histidine kinase n=1 Tax=Bradyrhizobium sp. JYMT SZCCT0180 TaxID=2807666 RepID=UPI001BA70144|nr:ABC transporter substrate binding protein [Bradyrhizobium sp. JYMT SZCCT0180]MBR1211225.1 PAS domain-containing protein [Bradyrhizobium sp. JYMT SZCCT0180]
MTTTRIALCSIGFLFCLAGEACAAERPRILMLHAFNYSFPATSMIAEAVRKRLVEYSKSVEIDAEFLDLSRNMDEAHALRTATFIRDKYGKHPPDLVMTIGSAALPFVIQYQDFLPKVPVVFASISPQSYAALRPPPGITGIITAFDLAKTLLLAERLQPEARRLYVIAGRGEADRRWQSTARRVIEEHGRKFETTFLFELPYAELIAELSKVPKDAIVIVLTIFVDGDGKTFVPAQIATELAGLSPAPVYGPYDTFIGEGAVGGFVETFESIGTATAEMAIEIMKGADPTTLAPRTNPNQHYRVDHRAMERWNLKERNLPPGTVVLFKPPTIWDQHRGTVVAALSVLGLQTAFLGALLIQWRRRQRAEALLRDSDDRMTFAATAANIGLWQLDRDTDELWVTEHCRALFGLPPDIPLTRGALLATVHPDDLETANSAIRKSNGTQRPAASDVRIVLRNGEVRWIRMRTHPYAEGNGETNQLGGIFVDLTDQKSAEAETALQRMEIEHLMRVSVLGALSGSIAHEINQPLTAILSNAQAALHLLGQKSPDLEEIRDALQDIVHEDNRASEVIQRLRQLLKKGEPKLEAVNINDLVRSTAGLLHSELIGREIRIRFDLENRLFLTRGDSVQLQQVLLNLVMNGMDAMAATPVDQRYILISTRGMESGSVELCVKDRGHGIGALAQDRLFEAFYTTKEHGLGLGLAICSAIIEAHGGRLALVSDASGGAIATISLPSWEATAS